MKLFDFRQPVIPGMNIVTTYRKKLLILENVYFYEGPVTMQYLPYGGIQSLFHHRLIVVAKNGFVTCNTVVYDGKRMAVGDFIDEFEDLINVVLPD